MNLSPGKEQPEGFVEVYTLADDHARIRKVQRATLNTQDYGLVPEHGLFGSEEWWDAIRSGEISTIRVEGIVSRVYMGSMNDWPEFEIDAGGRKTRWTRHVHRREDDAAYVVGRKVRLEYIVQKAKTDLGNLGTTKQEVVLRVAIEA